MNDIERIVDIYESFGDIYKNYHTHTWGCNWTETCYSDIYGHISNVRSFLNICSVDEMTKLLHKVLSVVWYFEKCCGSNINMRNMLEEYNNSYYFGVERLCNGILYAVRGCGNYRPCCLIPYFVRLCERVNCKISDILNRYCDLMD